ncbi:hypothetical protein OOK29_09595 [Streptomyces phaeochromogenes]|uniref:hypothetical protein n=1 Tax=Streptomyces phaeochromogenes TaxID=1923 RepID=UPI002250C86F|nr:hypothetical protein [Streptomyces phaeochromogenes]MCX5598390.1 hypothetical protein [Streptomyces phaeochromogenes]
MKYYLQVALRYLSGQPMPARCHDCGRFIFGSSAGDISSLHGSIRRWCLDCLR